MPEPNPECHPQATRNPTQAEGHSAANTADTLNTSDQPAFGIQGPIGGAEHSPCLPESRDEDVTLLSSQKESRYRSLRPLGRGGLGEVFVAFDGELHREVALKEIQACHLEHSDTRRRFLLEAEVTGNLEHPGIVPVYGLGTYADGRPFYAMRLIKGESLKDALNRFHIADESPRDVGERSLAFRGLLRRFLDVCNAVAFAHSKGVLHRDLKPENVMLGQFGETLVIDWGLAKVLDHAGTEGAGASLRTPSAADQTSATGIAGTPAYMSPEQAEGRTDDLEAASDVYSLGAILYVLVSGRLAFPERNVDALLAQVRRGDFRPPRQLNRGVPPALEAICLKAMALDPRSRYASANDLAADVDHWLADEPVTAWREPLTERLRRRARRHRALAVGLGVLLLTATAALGIGLALVNHEKNKTDAANTRLIAEEGKTKAALIAESKALDQSRTAAKSAAQQRQLALKTVRSVVEDIHGELKNTPAQQELRKKLLVKALAGLKEVARAADTEQQADHATIWVHFELGDLFLNVQEGGLTEARKQFQIAFELARSMADENPGDAEAQRDLSSAYQRLGTLLLQLGESDAALDALRASMSINKELAVADSGSARAQRDLYVLHNNLGAVQMQRGDTNAALVELRAAQAISQKLAADDPRDGEAQRDLFASHDGLGAILLRLGDTNGALAEFQAALPISQKLADAEPGNVQTQRDLARAHNRLGNMHLQLGETGTALAEFRTALTIGQKLADDDPRDAQGQRDLAIAHDNLGTALLPHGNTRAAFDAFKAALTTRSKLVDDDPNNAQVRRDLLVSHNNVGDVQLILGDSKAALESYQAGLTISRKLAADDPHSSQAQCDLALSHAKLGDVQLQLGDLQAALGAYETSKAIRIKLTSADARNAQAQRDLSSSHNNLGDTQLRMGDAKAALGAYRAAFAIVQQLAQNDPDSVQAQRNLFVSHDKLGSALWRSGDARAAVAEFQAALAISRKLAGDASNALAQYDLSRMHNNLGGVQFQLGDKDAARAAYRAALAINQKPAENDPLNALAQRDLFNSYLGLGAVAQVTFQFREAAEWYTKALSIPKSFPHPELFQKEVDFLKDRLRICKTADNALEDPTVALKEPEPFRVQILTSVSEALAKQGKHEKAVVAAELLAQQAQTPDDIYNAACAYAVSVIHAGTPERKEKYATRAVALLKQAVAKGYDDLTHMKKDSDLDALRSREDFTAMLRALEKLGDLELPAPPRTSSFPRLAMFAPILDVAGLEFVELPGADPLSRRRIFAPSRQGRAARYRAASSR